MYLVCLFACKRRGNIGIKENENKHNKTICFIEIKNMLLYNNRNKGKEEVNKNMKERKRNKQGISLIVLVITIIVMIILAAAVILSLSSNGIIDRANEAVDKTDEAKMNMLLDLAWTEAYLNGARTTSELETAIRVKMSKQNIDLNMYELDVTTNGITIKPSLSNIYFGRPYSMYEDGIKTSFVIYENGKAEVYVDGILQEVVPPRTMTYGTNVIMQDGEIIGEIKNNGEEITLWGNTTVVLDKSWCPHSEKGMLKIDNKTYGELYCCICGEFVESLEHKDKVPEGATYYVGVTATALGDYSGATAVYGPGSNFPTTVNTGDVYVYGDYEYRYNYVDNGAKAHNWKLNTESDEGWGVRVLDITKSSYGTIVASIGNKEVKNLFTTFWECQNLLDGTSLYIPKTVTNMLGAFAGCNLVLPPDLSHCENLKKMDSTFMSCQKMIEASGIPVGVESMQLTFAYCGSLSVAPNLSKCSNLQTIDAIFGGCGMLNSYIGSQDEDGDFSNYIIPQSVTIMSNAFVNCEGINVAPVIPKNVKSITATFRGCINLSGAIKINATPQKYVYCLENTKITEILGSCENKNEILATK